MQSIRYRERNSSLRLKTSTLSSYHLPRRLARKVFGEILIENGGEGKKKCRLDLRYEIESRILKFDRMFQLFSEKRERKGEIPSPIPVSPHHDQIPLTN